MLIFIHPKKQKKNVDFHVAVTQWAFFWCFLILGLRALVAVTLYWFPSLYLGKIS